MVPDMGRHVGLSELRPLCDPLLLQLFLCRPLQLPSYNRQGDGLLVRGRSGTNGARILRGVPLLHCSGIFV